METGSREFWHFWCSPTEAILQSGITECMVGSGVQHYTVCYRTNSTEQPKEFQTFTDAVYLGCGEVYSVGGVKQGQFKGN